MTATGVWQTMLSGPHMTTGNYWLCINCNNFSKLLPSYQQFNTSFCGLVINFIHPDISNGSTEIDSCLNNGWGTFVQHQLEIAGHCSDNRNDNDRHFCGSWCLLRPFLPDCYCLWIENPKNCVICDHWASSYLWLLNFTLLIMISV